MPAKCAKCIIYEKQIKLLLAKLVSNLRHLQKHTMLRDPAIPEDLTLFQSHPLWY